MNLHMREVAEAAGLAGFYSPAQRQWMRENGGLPWPPYALSELELLWDQKTGPLCCSDRPSSPFLRRRCPVSASGLPDRLESIDYFLDQLLRTGWAWATCPGIWTDLCRSIERWAREAKTSNEVIERDVDVAGWYTEGGRRPGLDLYCAGQIEKARRVPPGVARIGGDRAQPFWSPEFFRARVVEGFFGTIITWAPGSYFWSPELPEVKGVTRHVFSTVVDIFTWLADGSGVSSRLLRSLTSFLLLLCLALPVGAQTLRGHARVVDGDTLEVQGERVRLHGIDAPEKDQTCRRTNGTEYHCGSLALVRLEELIAGRQVRCGGREKDRYGRMLARCYVWAERWTWHGSIGEGPILDLGRALVVRGLALSYRKYSSDYSSAEATAKAARAGIWGGSFVPPAEWRKGVR